MKHVLVVTAMYFVLTLLSCQETKEDLKSQLSERIHYKSIGMEIPFETGMEWIEYYKAESRKDNSDQGRLGLFTPYSIPDSQIQSAMESVGDLTGIAFHYGLDDLGRQHILAIPVDETLSLWSPIPGRIFIDANTGEEISQGEAYQWAQRYKSAHPNDIWFHFFGQNIFEEICALPFFNSIEIEPAINILDLTPQLLLIIWNDDLLSLGRTHHPPALVYDASNACPPCAVQ